MREFWRPTEEEYWSRVKKSHALDAGKELLGLKWREEHESAKKSDIARALGAVFAGDAYPAVAAIVARFPVTGFEARGS
jgi:hypothetical protein